MARLLVHVVAGPGNPTRAALGLLVARTAARDGHEVSVFLAGDAVALVRPETAAVAHGIGTGAVVEHLAALREAGVRVFLSGMSSKARGIDESVAEVEIELAPPEKLVELATASETVLTY